MTEAVIFAPPEPAEANGETYFFSRYFQHNREIIKMVCNRYIGDKSFAGKIERYLGLLTDAADLPGLASALEWPAVSEYILTGQVCAVYRERRRARGFVLLDDFKIAYSHGKYSLNDIEIKEGLMMVCGAELDVVLSTRAEELLFDLKMLMAGDRFVPHLFHPARQLSRQDKTAYFTSLLRLLPRENSFTAPQIQYLEMLARTMCFSSAETLALLAQQHNKKRFEEYASFNKETKHFWASDYAYLLLRGKYSPLCLENTINKAAKMTICEKQTLYGRIDYIESIL